MPKRSAGLVTYRIAPSGVLEILIVHPGGPFWAKKDDGAWSIPKGEYEPKEASDPLAVAEREFAEELGKRPPHGERLDLGELRQPSGKRIVAWGVAGDVDVSEIKSNTFEMEWPPKSGTSQSFPEVDRAAWFPVTVARSKLSNGQVPFVDRLIDHLRDVHGLKFSEDVSAPGIDRPNQVHSPKSTSAVRSRIK
jgi:predicted NUDIX family NTP pyrophosphohydrolase